MFLLNIKSLVMKKIAFLLMVVISVMSVSCEKFEDVTVGIETNFEANMPVVSQKAGSTDLYNFIGGGSCRLSDNSDIRKHMTNLESIEALNGSLIQFNQAKEGGKITKMVLKYGIQENSGEEPKLISVFSFMGQLSEENGKIDYQNDSWAPNLMKAFSANKDKVFVIKIEGTATYNVNAPVKIDVPVKVNTKPLQ